ncbi:MAG: hypothetical protein LUQ41_01735 [Methanomicrobiales archaeon]|nr:hypothetical protein [Methanomicrobiales archaeon]
MHHLGPVTLCILAILIFGIPCVHAQAGVTVGPDMKWSYAQTYNEEQLAASGYIITGEDIAFARGRVADAEEDCANMGGVWCTYAGDDRKALQRMLNVQGRQTNNPHPDMVDTGPVPDLTNTDIISSAWKQLESIASQLADWIDGLFAALNI